MRRCHGNRTQLRRPRPAGGTIPRAAPRPGPIPHPDPQPCSHRPFPISPSPRPPVLETPPASNLIVPKSLPAPTPPRTPSSPGPPPAIPAPADSGPTPRPRLIGDAGGGRRRDAGGIHPGPSGGWGVFSFCIPASSPPPPAAARGRAVSAGAGHELSGAGGTGWHRGGHTWGAGREGDSATGTAESVRAMGTRGGTAVGSAEDCGEGGVGRGHSIPAAPGGVRPFRAPCPTARLL